MGFCRRCGEIVQGTRCKCGGTAVAPSLHFMNGKPKEKSPDRWSQTYVTKESTPPPGPMPSPPAVSAKTPDLEPSTPTRRFPRPQHVSTKVLSSGVSAHIASATAPRPDSPLKHGLRLTSSPSSSDILPSPHTDTLAKVYGSVLQRPETLATFNCFICLTPFTPDSTLYPDPNSGSTSKFLCRSCFVINGGSKGSCVSCTKPVLILPSEGGFVESAGKFWHKHCFRCDGCFKDISDKPLVDLFGKPSCEECFDHCLDRASPTNKPRGPKTPVKNGINNPGGMLLGKSRESSPAIQELSQKLGIKSNENTPSKLEFPQERPAYISPSANKFALGGAPDRSPIKTVTSRPSQELRGSGKFTPLKHQDNATIVRGTEKANDSSSLSTSAQELMRRLGSSRTTPTSSPGTSAASPNTRRQSKIPTPIRSYTSSIAKQPSPPSEPSTIAPNTPDLASDNSDGTWSSPPTPRFSFGENNLNSQSDSITPKSRRLPNGVSIQTSSSARCHACSKSLFTTQGGGRIVTVPSGNEKQTHSYHAACFLCDVCSQPFGENGDKQATFVKSDKGITHLHCAPPPKVTIVTKPVQSSKPINVFMSTSSSQTPRTAPPTSSLIPRFGSSTSCPGCHISVSPMERGVVAGPQSTRWHSTCLVCGGKGTKVRPRDNTPGCGKRLDSAAKCDISGVVWCRECLDLLYSHPPVSPTRSPISPTPTGGANRFPKTELAGITGDLVGQYTGTSGTTVRQHFTGNTSIVHHFTGGGTSPTRQFFARTRTPSPTKQLTGGVPVTRHLTLRPKSVVGIRGDHGRGMFLVRQMTGGSGAGQ